MMDGFYEGPCFEASEQQKWMYCSAAGRTVGFRLEIVGVLDARRLGEAVTEVVNANEILRTSVCEMDDKIVQSISPPAGTSWNPVANPAWRHGAVEVCLVRKSEKDHILSGAISAACADRRSVRLFAEEIASAYSGSKRSGETIQYADFSAWQNAQILQNDAPDSASPSAGQSQLGFERSSARPAAVARVTESVAIDLDAELATRAAEQLGVDRAAVLLSCWTALLLKFGVDAERGLGVLTEGRSDSSLETALGPFDRKVPLGVRADVEDSISALTAKVAARSRFALVNTFARRGSTVDTAPDYLFRYGFSALRAEHDWVAGGCEFALRPESGMLERHLLELQYFETENRLELVFEPESFDRKDVEQSARYFATLLSQASADPSLKLKELDLRSPTQRRREHVLVDSPAPADVHATLLERVFHHCEKTPEAVAVEGAGFEPLTYRDLRTRVAAIRRHLEHTSPIEQGEAIGLMLNRVPDYIASVLAVLDGGGAFVPIDPALPQLRLDGLVRELRVSRIVTASAALPRQALKRFDIPVVDVGAAPPAYEGTRAAPSSSAQAIAYILYTSGSTGEPKPVAIAMGALSRYVELMSAGLGISSKDTYLLTAPFSFSSAMRQMFLPLANGATIRLMDENDRADPSHILKAVSNGATVVDLTPSVLRSFHAYLSRGDERVAELRRSGLRRLLSASEALPRPLASGLLAMLPSQAKFFNMYGQTETTGIVSTHLVGGPDDDRLRDPVPIGKALDGISIVMLDDEQRPVPDGLTGEVAVLGPTLGLGYIGDGAARVRDRAFSAAPGGRKLYRTGDLGRRSKDDVIEYLGRRDGRIKVRGNRVDLLEVQRVLSTHPAVEECVVRAKQDGDGNFGISAYVVANEGQRPTLTDLNKFMEEYLPRYCLLQSVSLLNSMPRSQSGKTDWSRVDANQEPAAANRENLSEVERELSEIWRKILRKDIASKNLDFFELGGHSLLALELCAEIQDIYGARLGIDDILGASTIAGLANVVESRIS